MTEILKHNQLLLKQIIALIEQFEPTDYKKPIALLGGSSMGDHIRHILNFYQSLIKQQGDAVLDPADRDRNPKLSTIPSFTIEHFEKVSNELQTLNLNQKIKVLHENNMAQEALESSLGRELLYAFDHAIHHLAIIKIGLHSNFPYIKVDEDLGIAPSTIRFRKQNA